MRLIDADALDIDNLNRAYNDNFELDFGRLYTTDVIDMIANAPTINAIPIPEDATNGDAIKALFPNTEWHSAMKQTTIFIPQTAIYEKEVLRVSTDWWNAKYKR